MTDSQQRPAADAQGGLPYYEIQRQELKELLAKKRLAEQELAKLEGQIFQKETEYIENTPSGNIITGFDNYTKGSANAATSRRKGGPTEAHRVFSRSSISYNANAAGGSEAPTPGSTPAPTPGGESNASGHATPTSSAAPRPSGGHKKKKSVAALSSSGLPEDSETDAREGKKVRTNFGAARK